MSQIVQKRPGDIVRPDHDWWIANARPGFPVPPWALVIAVDRNYSPSLAVPWIGQKPAVLIVMYPGTGRVEEIEDAEYLRIVHR